MSNKITKVVSVKVKELRKIGCQSLAEWVKDPNHLYIGRDMSFYVPGATASKWSNPFPLKKHGRDKCLELYKEYIKNDPMLLKDLEELRGKELGCWCYPEKCHGDILVELLQ